MIKLWVDGISSPVLSPPFAVHASMMTSFSFIAFSRVSVKQRHAISNLLSEAWTQHGVLEIHPECSVLSGPSLPSILSSELESIRYMLVWGSVWTEGRRVKEDTKKPKEDILKK